MDHQRGIQMEKYYLRWTTVWAASHQNVGGTRDSRRGARTVSIMFVLPLGYPILLWE